MPRGAMSVDADRQSRPRLSLMTHATTLTTATPPDDNLLLLDGAIALIASGGARRVTLVAVQAAEALLPAAQALAREQGVIVRAIWRSGGAGCDIAVEPVG
jgi:hypothetical protein